MELAKSSSVRHRQQVIKNARRRSVIYVSDMCESDVEESSSKPMYAQAMSRAAQVSLVVDTPGKHILAYDFNQSHRTLQPSTEDSSMPSYHGLTRMMLESQHRLQS